jgi:hypothetical protein
VIGFVYEKTAGIQPILGIPGAATRGPAVLARAGFEGVTLAPGGDCALAVFARGRQVAIVRNLSSAPRTTVLNVPAGPARIAFSPSGDAAVLYYSDTARAEVLTGLPGSPSLAWGIDLAGAPDGVAALAVDDGGGALLVAAAGEPASIWMATPEVGQRFLYAASASPSLAFLSRSEDAVIADASTGDVILVHDPKGESQISRVGGPAQGISRPVAIAAARDNRRIFVVNAEPAGVVSLGLSGEESLRLACSCAPTTLERMAGGSTFRLTEPGRGPLWLLDAAGSSPRIVFVPGQAQTLRQAVPAAALTITTASPLQATIGVAYSQTFAASGGSSPYTWAIPSGTLPPGLSFSAGGLLSGTPTQIGLFTFAVYVADSTGVLASKPFSLLVILPTTPLISISGLTDTEAPAQQLPFDVQLSSPYWLDITGTITITFTPNAVNSSDDPSIQFSTGGRTLNFFIPAGQTTGSWATAPSVQVGTVAGLLKLAMTFSAGGQNLTPMSTPARLVTIALAAPQINSVQVVKTSGGFNILVTGYSTTREVTQANFDFTLSNGSTTNSTVALTSLFTTWYTSVAATQYGSAFLYTQPFGVKGNVSDIASVSVTLANSFGTATAVSASF